MQAQISQVPLFKQFRTTTPVRNWCLNQSVTEESYWTLERCIEEAAHFTTRVDWEKKSPVSYAKAIKRGWLTKCTTHIKGFKRKPAVPATWTLEKCIDAGRQCLKRAEFKKRFHYAYELARQKGWLETCCEHMT
ncbi:hypothetical protein [Polynucleobacter sp. MWH-Aus1W21]|uniref:hypothetical protein n=1 Tax=Polynucleobacter sp. MWH-Aus1W21 TaxID=1855880 RepID=UPI001BFE81B1|nr:hypothetical protein [Polynucleobacter sp. MWH-Aus1W21]QWD65472.1 hypothetical protein ICW03_07360 [Polynucleobacter sp. MWH-Aus1W21]